MNSSKHSCNQTQCLWLQCKSNYQLQFSGKPVKLSSFWDYSGRLKEEMANNGVYNNKYDFVSTEDDTNEQWWQVDLVDNRCITHVNVFNLISSGKYMRNH